MENSQDKNHNNAQTELVIPLPWSKPQAIIFNGIIFFKMKPLATSQRVLTYLRLLPARENCSVWEKRSYTALIIYLIVSNITVCLSSLMYTLYFMSTDFEGTAIAVCQIFAAMPMGNTIVVAFFFRHQIPSIFEKLSKIYEKCLYELCIHSILFFGFYSYVQPFYQT